jgi:hypothetical protein
MDWSALILGGDRLSFLHARAPVMRRSCGAEVRLVCRLRGAGSMPTFSQPIRAGAPEFGEVPGGEYDARTRASTCPGPANATGSDPLDGRMRTTWFV